jgi:hypothetical protein
MIGSLLLANQASFADASACDGSANDPATCTGKSGGGGTCIGDLSGYGPGINCTANDVRIGKASNIRDVSGNIIESCTAGSTLSATGDFMVLTGTARYDIGLYFSTDTDNDNNGAKSGQCVVTKLTYDNNVGDKYIPPNANNFINLDLLLDRKGNIIQPGDSCGDINTANNPQWVRVSFTAPCVASTSSFYNPDTKSCEVFQQGQTLPADWKPCVRLPNAVSWRQDGANGVCDSPLDAYPGTTAKCKVDADFGIPVKVEQANIAVTKSPATNEVQAPGNWVLYTVQVQNKGSYASMEITTLTDTIGGCYYDLSTPDTVVGTGDGCKNLTENNCNTLIGDTLGPAHTSAYCSFKGPVIGDGGTSVSDTVKACGATGGGSACNTATARVDITLASTPPTVTKTPSWRMDATYTVVVSNPSSTYTFTVTKLEDLVTVGSDTTTTDITSSCTPVLTGSPIDKGQTRTCTFTKELLSKDVPYTNTVKVTGKDNSLAQTVMNATASATVEVNTSHSP